MRFQAKVSGSLLSRCDSGPPIDRNCITKMDFATLLHMSFDVLWFYLSRQFGDHFTTTNELQSKCLKATELYNLLDNVGLKTSTWSGHSGWFSSAHISTVQDWNAWWLKKRRRLMVSWRSALLEARRPTAIAWRHFFLPRATICHGLKQPCPSVWKQFHLKPSKTYKWH